MKLTACKSIKSSQTITKTLISKANGKTNTWGFDPRFWNQL